MKKYVLIYIIVFCCISTFASPQEGVERFAAGDYAGALELLEPAAAATPHDPILALYLGRSLMRLGNASRAADVFGKVIKGNPASADAHYWYGAANGQLTANASIFKAGPYARLARTALARALELQPGHAGAQLELLRYLSLAPKLYGGDRQQAEALAAELAAGGSGDAKLALGEMFASNGDSERAAELLHAMDPAWLDNPRASFLLGMHHQSRKEYALALDWLERAMNASATDFETRYARQSASYQLGRTAVFAGSGVPRGIAGLERYVSETPLAGTPGTEWGLFRLGQLYEQDQRHGIALETYRKALTNASDDRLLRQRLKRRIRALAD